MKYIKKYEYFTSSSTFDDDFSYNKKKVKLSKLVRDVVTYINNHDDPDKIVQIYSDPDKDYSEIAYGGNSNYVLKSITVKKEQYNKKNHYTLGLRRLIHIDETETYTITKQEYKYLEDVIADVNIRSEERSQKNNTIYKDIAPENIEAEKFNL